MKNYNILLIALLIISGCSNAPKENTSKLTLGLAQSAVTKGANQTEIIKVLGAPNIISRDKQGNETWTYDRISREAQSNSRSGAGFGALFGWVFAGGSNSASSSTSNKSLTVIITFDDNKSVIDYAYQSLEF